MIIQSILPIDAKRYTTNLCVAARAAATGFLFKPEDIFRLLVWHAPVFEVYAQAMSVLRAALAQTQATQLQVQAVMPKLFLLSLHRPSPSDPMSIVGGVLLELHPKGHILSAELLGTAPGPLTARFEVYSSTEQPEGWLQRLEQSWTARPMRLSDLPREPQVVPPALKQPKKQERPRPTRGERPVSDKREQQARPKTVEVIASQQPLPLKPRSTAEIKRPSRRERQIAQREARQLAPEVSA